MNHSCSGLKNQNNTDFHLELVKKVKKSSNKCTKMESATYLNLITNSAYLCFKRGIKKLRKSSRLSKSVLPVAISGGFDGIFFCSWWLIVMETKVYRFSFGRDTGGGERVAEER